jgi:multicomponent K+:H+ antiporter subunit E
MKNRPEFLPHPLLTPILICFWLLLNNSLAPGQILLGLLLAWVIPAYTQAYWPHEVPIKRPGRLLLFLGRFLVEILLANLAVARLILAGPRVLRPAFVVVPLRLRHELALSLLANIICLTPGTVSARLSKNRRELLVHALDCADPSALVAGIQQRFEAPLQEIFEC